MAVVGQDRRISLVLHLGPDISLEAANTTRTPYLIAGHYGGGEEAAFMCPAVGSNEAILQVQLVAAAGLFGFLLGIIHRGHPH